MPQLEQQIALVTGAGKGIGRAVAEELAARGAFVYVNFKSDEASARETVDRIISDKGTGELAGFDVTDTEMTAEAVKKMARDKGRIDILVNNAGIRNDKLLAMMKKDAWQQVIEANLSGFYNVTKPVVKVMLKNRFGRIVNMASAAGQTGNSGQVNYSASKAGLIGATKALAREVAKRNITVNAVAPGFIETAMLEGMKTDKLLESIPAGRLGTPEEVAYTVGFLCSSQAAYITGQVIGINGGMV